MPTVPYEFSSGDSPRIPLYIDLIAAATEARPTPYQSKYHVRGAGLTRSGLIIPGGNHEYGLQNGLHCEETIVANALELVGDPLIALAFVHDGPVAAPASPCGNCRDVLKQYATPDAEIITASTQGGPVLVTPFSSYLKEEFTPSRAPPAGIAADRFWPALDAAVDAIRRAYSVYGVDKMYGAAIFGGGRAYGGSFIGDAAYHCTYPLRSAMINLIQDRHPERFDLEFAIIAFPSGGRIDVPYIERQHLMEMVTAINARFGRRDPLPVIMSQFNGDEDMFCRTDSDEWLPMPFNPAHLGMQDKLADAIRKMI
jgi:cytidine deaminase